MATFVSLVHWTKQGVDNIKDTVKRAEDAAKMAESMGGHITNIVWTLGKYDLVVTSEFPDDATAAAWTAGLVRKGNITTQTMRAFTANEVQKIIDKIP